MSKDYYHLLKPGIIYGNAIVALGGFLLASRGHVDVPLLIEMIIGLSLIVASSCVFNNLIDSDIDKEMERTKKRALVSGTINRHVAEALGLVLGVAGALILTYYTNLLALEAAFVGFFVYVFIYSLWAKRKSLHSTVIGSIAGATPPLVGYLAVTNRLDVVALLLFLVLVTWQMPHFFAIAIYRLKEYKAAGIPLFPIKRGVKETKALMLVYVVLFVTSSMLLHFLGYVGMIYGISLGLLGFAWLALGIQGFYTKDDVVWAKRMFFLSIVIIFAFSVLISVDWL